jgi:fluoride exporter
VPSFSAIAAVAVGGALGCVARLLISTLFVQRFGAGFPYGTLFINVTGSFLIGFVIELSQTRAFGVTPLVRLMLATGVLGGYTTFSSFSYETFTLASEGNRSLSLLYAGGSVVLGVAAYIAGTILARLLLRPARG